MKAVKVMGKSVVVLAILILSLGLQNVKAYGKSPIVLGEFCWVMMITEDETGPVSEGPVLVRTAITHVDGRYFTLQGIIEIPPGDRPPVFAGAGVLVENEAVLTISSGQEHSDNQWVDMGVSQIRLNLSNLNGTVVGTRLDFDRSARVFDFGFSAGTLTFVSCP